jgi:hypothetical protein
MQNLPYAHIHRQQFHGGFTIGNKLSGHQVTQRPAIGRPDIPLPVPFDASAMHPHSLFNRPSSGSRVHVKNRTQVNFPCATIYSPGLSPDMRNIYPPAPNGHHALHGHWARSTPGALSRPTPFLGRSLLCFHWLTKGCRKAGSSPFRRVLRGRKKVPLPEWEEPNSRFVRPVHCASRQT